MLRPARWIDLAVYILIALFAVVQWAGYERSPGYLVDSAYFIGLTRSLLETGHYSFDFKPHTRFPIGTPLLLAAGARVFGFDYAVLVRIGVVAGIAGILLAYWLLRREQGRACAAAAVLLLVSAPYYFVLATRSVGSDLPFLLVSFLAILLLRRWEAVFELRRRTLLAAGFTAAVSIAVLIRSAGIALWGGLLLWLAAGLLSGPKLLRLRLKYFFPALVLPLALEAGWMLWVKKVQVLDYPGEYMHSYAAQMLMKDPLQPELGKARPADFPARALRNVVLQTRHFAQLVGRLAWVNPLWYSPLVMVPLVLMLCGWAASRPPTYLEFYFIAYAAIYLLWPFDEGVRFLLPVFPLAFLYFWRGGKAVLRNARIALWATLILAMLFAVVAVQQRAPGAQGKLTILFWVAAIGVVAALLAVPRLRAFGLAVLKTAGPVVFTGLVLWGVWLQLEMLRENLDPNLAHRVHPALTDAASWIEKAAPRSAVIMAGEENGVPIIHVVSGRKTVAFPVTRDAAFIERVLRAHGVGFLVVDDTSDLYFHPTQPERMQALIAAYPNLLQMVYQGPGYRIFRVSGASSSP